MLKVFEAFAGVGSQRMALRNIGIDHEVVAISEIDKFAIKSYEAIHGETLNLGDISKINVEDIPDHDLFTYSFPCQDISVAGKQCGLDMDSGTRSGLLWECQKVIATKKPKYLLLENVKNLVGKRHKHNFDKWLDWLEIQGYTNYWQVLNAKNYGVSQNRERVFVVSILGSRNPFEFPEPKKLEKKLIDVLENDVDEKFYLTNENAEKLININFNQNNLIEKIKKTDTGICPTLDTMQGGWRQPMVRIKNATKKGYLLAGKGDAIDLSFPTSNTRRGRVQKGVSQTLQTAGSLGTFDGCRIRKLTPLECWRLMGFSDTDFYKAQEVNSNSQLYKQAGNSIVVPVLEEIFKQMFK